MKYFIDRQLKKKLEKPEYVWLTKQLARFADEVEKVKGYMNALPSGFWVRKIVGTEIYKFRLNNGDRMLFCFTEKQNELDKAVVFLDYCTHDQQVYTAQRTNKHFKVPQNIAVAQAPTTDDKEERFEQSVAREYRFAHSPDGIDISQLSILEIEDDSALKKIISLPDDELIYRLSDKQYECLKNVNKPVILTGSAGTGKTLIAIHHLLAQVKENKRGLYTCYNKMLAEEASRIFNANLHNRSQRMDIVDINRLFCRRCGKAEDKLIQMNQFSEWLTTMCYQPRKMQFSLFDLWAEIRGVLKGYMGDFSATSPSLLPLDYYVSKLPKGYSRFAEQDRKTVHAIANEYNEWLKEKGLFDENDLARMYTVTSDKELYDSVIIDEVQDLSEAQIYALRFLVHNQNSIMILGDIRQNVHSSFFSFGRVRSQFFATGVMAAEYHLIKNYRSKSEIVKISNKLLDLQKRIVSLQQPYNIPETFVVDGGTIELIDDETAVKTGLLELILSSPQSAIVVTDEKEAESAEGKFRALLEDRYIPSGRIFAVPEVKGLEFKRVICFNMVGKYRNELDELLQADVKNSVRHQHILSMFYVAISRACETLIFYESESMDNHTFLDYVMHSDQNEESTGKSKPADSIGDEAEHKLPVRELCVAENVQNIKENLLKEDRSKKMWLREAKRYQRNGNYKQALEIYKKFNQMDEYKKCVDEIQGINKMIERLRATDKNPPAESAEKNARQQSDIDDYLAIRGLSDKEKFDYFCEQSLLHYNENKFFEALQAIKQALAIRTEPWLFGQCGMLLLFNHEYDQAIQYFNLAQDEQTMEPVMYVMRAEAYSALGQNSLALQDCDKAEIEGCPDVFLCKIKAQVLYAMQQFEKTIPYFQKAAKNEPGDIFLRCKLINCYVYTGSFDLALKEAENMERHAPNNVFVVCLLILVLVKTKQIDFARIKCQHYIRVSGLPKTVDDTLKEFVEKAKEWDVEHHGQDWVTLAENRKF